MPLPFSDDAAARISRAVRWVEGNSSLGARPEGGPRLNETLYVARCTGAVDGSGNYPGTIVSWDGSAWQDHGVCKLRGPNGEALSSGVRYACAPLGTASGTLLLIAVSAGANMLRGKLGGALSAGGSATMSIWYYNGSAEADTAVNITVYDWLLASGSIASGKKVVAHWDARSGRYYVTAAEC